MCVWERERHDCKTLLPVARVQKCLSYLTVVYVLQDAYSPNSSSPVDPLGGYMTMIQHGTGISKFPSFHGSEYSGSGVLGWAHIRLSPLPLFWVWMSSYHTPFNPEGSLQNICCKCTTESDWEARQFECSCCSPALGWRWWNTVGTSEVLGTPDLILMPVKN